MSKDLFDLPRELWIQIFSDLDAITLAQCAMTCKYMYDTFQSSSQLLYIVQLHLDGSKDAGTSRPHSELIQHLLRRRKAWLSLTPSTKLEHVTLEMKNTWSEYAFAGGAFANIDRQHLEIVWLPTTSTGNSKTRTLQRALTGISVRKLAMDPTQDLIVLLDDSTIPSPMDTRTLRIHIHTLSTNITHPLAHQSPLFVTVPSHPVHGNSIHSIVLQIARNTLVLYFYSSRPWIHIWDWTTSSVLADGSTPFDPLLPSVQYELGLLDSTYFFIASLSDSGSFRLYKLDRSPVNHGPIHLATLRLPPTSSEGTPFRIVAHAGPIEANPLPHAPFTINDDDRLHVFNLLYEVVDLGTVASLNVFVHQRVFTKYCMQGTQRRRIDPTTTPLDVPWADWGPPNTHLISPFITPLNWSGYVHGQRIIYEPLPHNYVGLPRPRVHILDFSRAAVLSATDVGAVHDKSRRLVLSSDTHTSRLPFLEDVKTYLPYVSSTLDRHDLHSTHMIYGDGIVGVDSINVDGVVLHVYPISQDQTSLETLVD